MINDSLLDLYELEEDDMILDMTEDDLAEFYFKSMTQLLVIIAANLSQISQNRVFDNKLSEISEYLIKIDHARAKQQKLIELAGTDDYIG